MAEFSNVDRRARDYLKSGQQLMAGDVIFTEGGQTASMAAQQVNAASTAEHQAVMPPNPSTAKQQAAALGGAAISRPCGLARASPRAPQSAAVRNSRTAGLTPPRQATAPRR